MILYMIHIERLSDESSVVLTGEKIVIDGPSIQNQSLSKKALQPSFQWNFDEYKFKKVGELESFLPIDDDTWGEFLIQQNGFDGKFNFIQHRNSFIISILSDFRRPGNLCPVFGGRPSYI